MSVTADVLSGEGDVEDIEIDVDVPVEGIEEFFEVFVEIRFKILEEDGFKTIFEHVFEGKEVEGFPGVLAVFVKESAGGEDHVDVGIEVQLFAEGMQTGADGRDKMAFIKPRENSFGRSLKEEFQEMRMLLKEIPEIIRNGKSDVVVLDVG